MRRRRRLWILLLSAPVLLVAGDVTHWNLAERQLEAGFAAWMAGRRAAGWSASAGSTVRGGWPLAATLTVPDVSLKGGDPDIPGGLTWSTDRLVLRIPLLHPRTLDVASEGMQRLRFGEAPEIPYTADRLEAVLPLEAGVPPHAFEVMATNLRAGVAGIGTSNAGLTIGSLQFRGELRPSAPAGAAVLAFSLNAEAISPPAVVARALGPRIASISLEGGLDGPLPRRHPLTERAVAWRDGGGTLEIQRFAVSWGPLDLTVTATLALDDQLQPMGAGSARAVGFAETLDALAVNGVLSRSAATAAKAVLSLLAHTPDDGSQPDVEVPLTLQYRTLSMRQVPLIRLPELDWP